MRKDEAEQLMALKDEMKQVASKKGAIDSWWDIIFDINALLYGERTLSSITPEQMIDYAKIRLKERLSQTNPKT
ncbi:MAG: hypothetical protein ACNA7G_12615 [Methylobacter sp.]